MTRSPGRQRAGAALAVLGAAACALALVAVSVPASAEPVPDAPDGVTRVSAARAPRAVTPEDDAATMPVDVQVTAITPQVLAPGEDLVVSVRIRNTGDVPVAEPRVALTIDRSAFIGRYSLDRWRTAAPDAPIGLELASTEAPGPLAPGQQATIELVVPAAQIGLPRRASAWGARGIAVSATDRADAARGRLGVARTFLLWFPDQEVNATRMSVLAPVVGPAADATADTWVPALEELTDDDGRLATVLAATADAPGVTWLLDPWLLDAVERGGPAAREWGDALTDAMTDREVQLLPYLDADLAALAHIRRGDLADLAIDRAETTARLRGLPDASRVRLALPADDEPDLATAALAADAGLALVSGPGTLLPPAVLTFTPSGRATLLASGEEVTVLIPDARLSAALTTGRITDPVGVEARAAAEEDPAGEGPAEAPAPVSWTTVTPTTAAQDLLAELAVITRERPNDSRHMLATVPRGWEPDPAVVQAQLDALEAAPWVRLEPVSALIGLANPEIERGTLPARTVDGTEVDEAEVAALAGALERRRGLVAMLTDPESSLGDPDLETLAPLSVAWRADTDGRTTLVQRSRAATATLADAISVSPTTQEGINVLSTSADLPVNVANALDEDVTVVVRLRPDDARLRAQEPVTVTIPAGGQVLVQVPIHAVSSADVSVTVVVLTPDGVLVDDDTSFLVRVRAEWEGIGTAVLGALLALGVVVGIVRTVRRGRGARRAAPEPDAGPDALSPEESEKAHL